MNFYQLVHRPVWPLSLPAFLQETESLSRKMSLVKGVEVCVWEGSPKVSVRREAHLRRRGRNAVSKKILNPLGSHLQQTQPEAPGCLATPSSSWRWIPGWANGVWNSAASPRKEQEEIKSMWYGWGWKAKASRQSYVRKLHFQSYCSTSAATPGKWEHLWVSGAWTSLPWVFKSQRGWKKKNAFP